MNYILHNHTVYYTIFSCIGFIAVILMLVAMDYTNFRKEIKE